jgi:hypothetical protein
MYIYNHIIGATYLRPIEAPTSEVGYTLATTRRGATKSIWTCGGIGEKSIIVKGILKVGMFANLKKEFQRTTLF